MNIKHFFFLLILEIKVVPMEFDVPKRCKELIFIFMTSILIIFFYSGFMFCKNRPTTTPPPLIFPEQLQKLVERDRNLDHFPILKQTFGKEKFSRNLKKKEESSLERVGKNIAYIFQPFTNLVMSWF